MENNKVMSPVVRSWGRRKHANSSSGWGALTMMLAAPLVVLLFSVTMEFYDGSLLKMLRIMTIQEFWRSLNLQATLQIHQSIASFVVLQAGLFKFLPGSRHKGQFTPAGHVLEYKTNGLLACIMTCGILGLGEIAGFMRVSFIAANWSSVLMALNIWGMVVTVAVYLKARFFPTHAGDRVFSGNIFYDLFMGVELNPQLTHLGDIKLFINGRIGMMAWPLIILSHAALQHETYGFISDSMLVVLGLQMIYIVDFFWNEHWYLQTIDIAHDHVGFYLSWGCIVWLPTMYTLQAQYLARSPTSLKRNEAVAAFLVGVFGYLLFRSANNQKYRVRSSHGQCKVWGRPATFIVGHYQTSDGVMRKSLLLTNGWWGMARHINYLGDLIMSFAMCAACGTTHILPWFYAFYMSTLLWHRCYRDEARCEMKYGSCWKAYCNEVRWRIVPYLF